MPKNGFQSITVSDELNSKISTFIDNSQGIVSNKSQALGTAWQIYEKIFLEDKNPSPIIIGNKLIGPKQPIFIIAEVGINHNGDMKLCKKIIDVAVESGCHAVKFQKRTIEVVYTKEELEKPRESPYGTTNGDQKRGLEFGKEEYAEIDAYCKKKGIIWFASPWDEQSVDFLEKFDVPCYKIASCSLTDKGLLKKIKDTNKPIIISTGMSTMEEIKKAVEFLGEKNLIIMHCTSTYPTEPEEQNLKVINTLRKYFNCPIGYSGHEPGVVPTILTMAMGVCIIERHITINRTMYGSDQAASLEPKGISMICAAARYAPIYAGDENKVVFESEKQIINKLRRVNDI